MTLKELKKEQQMTCMHNNKKKIQNAKIDLKT